VPPGYKDASKDDGGIGDFLIWKTLLLLGEREKKDMVFVTGKQKPDWFNQASGAPTFPRYELIDEFRRASAGKGFGLMTLHQLLVEMHVSDELVKDIQKAEDEVRLFSPQLHTSSLNSESIFTTRTLNPTAGTTFIPGSSLFKFGETGTLFPSGTTFLTTAPALPSGTIFVPSGNLSLSDEFRSATKTSDKSGGGENQ
jgi:hypothetical protein